MKRVPIDGSGPATAGAGSDASCRPPARARQQARFGFISNTAARRSLENNR
jgi:hypothetical protein